MINSACGKYHLRSAYQFAYLFIFAIAIGRMGTSVLGSDNPILIQMDHLRHVISKDAMSFPIMNWLLAAPFCAMLLFVVAFSFHLIRIYITLEFMDDGEWQYSSYFENYGNRGRIIDFGIRAIIIATLSLKVIEVHGFKNLPGFVLAFYASLSLWTVNAMWSGKKKWSESFASSSLSGLIMAALFFYLSTSKADISWQLLVPLLLVSGFVLLVDLSWFVYRNGKDILGIYRQKFVSAW